MRKYRFSHRSGGRYYWWSVLTISPRDSRSELISCDVDWFWAPERGLR